MRFTERAVKNTRFQCKGSSVLLKLYNARVRMSLECKAFLAKCVNIRIGALMENTDAPTPVRTFFPRPPVPSRTTVPMLTSVSHATRPPRSPPRPHSPPSPIPSQNNALLIVRGKIWPLALYSGLFARSFGLLNVSQLWTLLLLKIGNERLCAQLYHLCFQFRVYRRIPPLKAAQLETKRCCFLFTYFVLGHAAPNIASLGPAFRSYYLEIAHTGIVLPWSIKLAWSGMSVLLSLWNKADVDQTVWRSFIWKSCVFFYFKLPHRSLWWRIFEHSWQVFLNNACHSQPATSWKRDVRLPSAGCRTFECMSSSNTILVNIVVMTENLKRTGTQKLDATWVPKRFAWGSYFVIHPQVEKIVPFLSSWLLIWMLCAQKECRKETTLESLHFESFPCVKYDSCAGFAEFLVWWLWHVEPHWCRMLDGGGSHEVATIFWVCLWKYIISVHILTALLLKPKNLSKELVSRRVPSLLQNLSLLFRMGGVTFSKSDQLVTSKAALFYKSDSSPVWIDKV